jgi:Fe-S-cluster containining protein
MNQEPWYHDGLQFGCKACGRCCGGGPGYVWITQEEIDRMAKRLGLSTLLFEQAFVWTVRGRKRSLKEYPNGDCVLLDEKTRGCKVYDERPIQCRTWPFWSQNIDTPNSWKTTAKFCPGCNSGKFYTLAEIEKQRNSNGEWGGG